MSRVAKAPATTTETAPGEQDSGELMSALMKTPLPEGVKKDIQALVDSDDPQAAEMLKVIIDKALQDADVISDDMSETMDHLIAELDKKLSDQVNEILHHSDFQKLEGSWRGLERLVFNTPISTELKIRVMNISKDELRDVFKEYKGAAFDQSPLFFKIHEEEFGMFNGQPYGCLIGDYEFSHRPKDIDILSGIAKIASSSHAPFIAAASPELMDLKSWRDLNIPPDMARLFDGKQYAAWRGLRESEDSRYLALTLPRTLARRPYGPNDEPVDEFAFEEDVSQGKNDKFTWSNAAYAMGENIARAFNDYGWCAQIRGVESGGRVNDLPVYTFKTSEGGVDMTCPTEIGIPFRRDKELSDCGFMPILHAKNENYAAFISGQTLHKPEEYLNKKTTKNASLHARLPYVFALSRFSHFLKKMVYNWVGRPMPRAKLEQQLKDWIGQYVCESPEIASDRLLAEKPLAAADVIVEEDPEDAGVYSAKFLLQPHFQLEELKVSLRLVSKVPKPGSER